VGPFIMRKIDQQVARAFWSREPLKISNTVCTTDEVFLHGNKIIRRERDQVWFSLAGWNTPVTRRRISAILSPHVALSAVNRRPYAFTQKYGTFRVDSNEWYRAF
jgi:hypothetical protein